MFEAIAIMVLAVVAVVQWYFIYRANKLLAALAQPSMELAKVTRDLVDTVEDQDRKTNAIGHMVAHHERMLWAVEDEPLDMPH